MRPDGTYNYRYESSNGIAASENGLGGYSSGGSAQWISPEGIPILLRYEADANGYRAFGDHLPTAHPIPDYILKSIEQNRIAAADRAAKGIPDEYWCPNLNDGQQWKFVKWFFVNYVN